MSEANSSQPKLVPINGLFVGDIVTHLVVVNDTDTIAELAEKVAQYSVGIKVAPQDMPMEVLLEDGLTLPMDMTVAEAGISPTQFVRVRYAS
jgi:hypothetical protein